MKEQELIRGISMFKNDQLRDLTIDLNQKLDRIIELLEDMRRNQ